MVAFLRDLLRSRPSDKEQGMTKPNESWAEGAVQAVAFFIGLFAIILWMWLAFVWCSPGGTKGKQTTVKKLLTCKEET
jgi:hypothetical protein